MENLWSIAFENLNSLAEKEVEFFPGYQDAEEKYIGVHAENIMEAYEGALVDSFLVERGPNTDRKWTLLLETYTGPWSSGLTAYCFDDDGVAEDWYRCFAELNSEEVY